MNDIIKQLYLSSLDDRQEFCYQKFAELIIFECTKVAIFKDSGIISSADVAGHVAAGRSIAAKMIKQHFGVK